MAKKFYYGGQAIIEGVMMRGQKTLVNAVRRRDGSLAVDTQPLATIYTGKLRQTPFIRGVIVLIEAMVLGIKSLMYSANVALEEEGEKVSGGLAWIMVIFSLAFAVGLFFLVPLFITKLLNFESSLIFNLVDGLIRVVIFIVYLRLVTLLPDIKRVFAYHGAEHKAINAFEAGVPLEIEAVKEYNTAHRRCGTGFLVMVVVISVFVFALVGLHTVWLMVLSRIVLIPVIAMISYEVIYFGARHVDNVFIRIIMLPGLLLQKLTTREPDDNQLEVAITALKTVVEADRLEEAPQIIS